MAGMGEDVYCTLLMSNSYLIGALVLAHSLRDAQTSKKLAVLVTLDTVSPDSVADLKEIYDYVIPVDKIRNPNPENLFLMDRGDLAFAFTKIAVWRLLQFRKVVYLDADVVALRAPDELFDIEAPFAAAPDIGWPDAFNTGVMVISPNIGEYLALQNLAEAGNSFDGADQGLLNQYYQDRDWHRISFTYNCTPNAQYQWEPAFRHFKTNISMVHFIGRQKPWSSAGVGQQGSSSYNELLSSWWTVHDKHMASLQITSDKSEADEARHPSTINEESNIIQPADEESFAGPENYITEATPPVIPTKSTKELLSQPENSEVSEDLLVKPSILEKKEPSCQENVQWDATKSAPPSDSKAEAINLPSHIYHFSNNNDLFRAPTAYADPPKDMYYAIPITKPIVHEKPKPIFPWEERAMPPTRVFLEDFIPDPKAVSDAERDKDTMVLTSLNEIDSAQRIPYVDEISAAVGKDPAESVEGRAAIPSDEPWQGFVGSSNAWDSVPGINTYVRAVKVSQERLKRTSVPSISNVKAGREDHAQRGESLIITDFPTELERPSLPVTPAPVQRATFWGDEREASIALPPAEGVPSQADWNPSQKLEELRGNFLLDAEHVRMPIPHRATPPPLRELPERLTNISSTLSADDKEGLFDQKSNS